jgi:type II secretory pathway predicted ATPase ExeA
MRQDSHYVSTPTHDAAVAQLLQAIEARERVVILRADAGLGKTIVLARALERARDPWRRIALVTNPTSGLALLDSIARALHGRRTQLPSRDKAWRSANDAVRLCRLQGISAVIAVDDDQALEDAEDRHDLNRLADLDPHPRARLTIVRSGRPGRDNIPRDWGRELTIRLAPLTRTEAAHYVAAKLVAARYHTIRFAIPAATRLHALAQGVPRRLDHLASLAVLAAQPRGLDTIPAEIVDGVAEEALVDA